MAGEINTKAAGELRGLHRVDPATIHENTVARGGEAKGDGSNYVESAARDGVYSGGGLSPKQRACLMIEAGKCMPELISKFGATGEIAYNEAMRVIAEAIEFTKKPPL